MFVNQVTQNWLPSPIRGEIPVDTTAVPSQPSDNRYGTKDVSAVMREPNGAERGQCNTIAAEALARCRVSLVLGDTRSPEPLDLVERSTCCASFRKRHYDLLQIIAQKVVSRRPCGGVPRMRRIARNQHAVRDWVLPPWRIRKTVHERAPGFGLSPPMLLVGFPCQSATAILGVPSTPTPEVEEQLLPGSCGPGYAALPLWAVTKLLPLARFRGAMIWVCKLVLQVYCK